MRPARLLRCSISTAALLAPMIAFAHPGHDGGHGDGLTWDFAGEVLHHLTSPYHLVPVLAAAALVFAGLRWASSRKKRSANRRPAAQD